MRVWQGSQGAFWGALGACRGWGGIGHGGEGVNALTGACRGLCVGLGVWDAGQRDSVGGCLGIWGACGRAQGRGACGVVWGWAGYAGRGLGGV